MKTDCCREAETGGRMGGEGNKRLYVGNLFTGVTEQDITKRY